MKKRLSGRKLQAAGVVQEEKMNGEIFDKIEKLKLVPVVKINNIEDALPLAEALCRGGLPVAEITFRTEAAEEAIRKIRAAFPKMLVGAGTVINKEQAERALAAGAQFLVSPGTSEEILAYAKERKVPVFPGVCTPSELMTALAYDVKVVKFFPASCYGGLKTIEALAAPFSQIRFMPTGGVNAANLQTYLQSEKIIACGGSWMVKEGLLKEKRFDEVERLTREAVALAERK